MSQPAGTPPATAATWTRQAERSSAAVMRFMVWLSLTLGRRASRVVLHGIAAYFLLFAPAAGRASRGYLTRILGRPPTLAERYRHVFTFATTIHDRIYFLNGRFDSFDIEIKGAELVDAALADGRGLLLFGAHLGSFEVLRALGRHNTDRAVCMLMHEENARKINSVLATINPAATQDMLALGHLDSMLELRDRLDAGQMIGILADRAPRLDATAPQPFLGGPAAFPVGPFRLAAILRRPVIFMSGLHLGGARYRVEFSQLADFGEVDRKSRDAAIAAAQQHYAALLAERARSAPFNWFNFFDFWRAAGADDTPP
ncbi:acyl-CoA synthetase [Zoogloea sp.]|uniref:LpxL/LpxP family acyltransferase n=1 Tax=Zoogloea sp. TaxID=49181 RepID=UPI0026209BC4|nr:acyl-CoA synthetase [Zoogloea sp.]